MLTVEEEQTSYRSQTSGLLFHYRASPLYLNEQQKLIIESMFGLSRMIQNNLLTKMSPLSDIQASGKILDMDSCLTETLKYLNDRNFDSDQEKLLTPGVVRSILTAFISEWNDFRSKRIKRPQFKTYQDSQVLWFLDDTCFNYSELVFELPDAGLKLSLNKSRYNISPRSGKAHFIRKEESGDYVLYSLHEKISSNITTQDEIITAWGEKILSIERELYQNRRRYLNVGGGKRRQSGEEKEFTLMVIRKITLDRLIRSRDGKLKSFNTEE